MKRFTLFNTLVLIIFSLALVVSAGDKSHEHHAENVIKVDDMGHETALCACGKEVSVTESTSKYVNEGKTYYLCSDECKAQVNKSASTILPALDIKVMAKKAELGTLGNVYAVSETGEKTAKCACGMDLKVNDSTVKREYNGQTYYICSDKCAAVFDKDPKKFIDAVK